MVVAAKEYQLVVIGGGGVGKSALTVQFIQGHFIDEYDPTIEDSYRKDVTIGNETVSLDILDTAGQEEYSAMREQYVRSGQGFLLVYSVTSRSSFDEIQQLYQQIMRAKNNDPSFPIVLVGNKSDLEDQREVPTEEGQRLANRLNLKYIETSAKLRTNVDESFHELTENVLTYDKQREMRARTRSQSRHNSVAAGAGTSAATAQAPKKQQEQKESSTCCLIA